MADKVEGNPQKQEHINTPFEGLALAIGIAGCGVLLNIFPHYAHIHSDWAYFYVLLGYLAYLFGVLMVVGAAYNDANDLIQRVGFAIAFSVGAFIFHDVSGRFSGIAELLFRNIVLLLMCCSAIVFAWCIPALFRPSSNTEGAQLPEKTGQTETPKHGSSIFWPERIIALFIALVALATAVVQYQNSANGS